MMKNSNTNQFEKIWQELISESSSSTSEGFLIRRILPESKKDLFLGIEKQHKTKVFILNIGENTNLQLRNFPESNGILIKKISLPHESIHGDSIAVFLRDDRFSDIFSSLVADICEKLTASDSNSGSVDILRNRLKKWQVFFEQNKPQGLSEEAVIGLFGELNFLNSYLISSTKSKSILAWKGFQNTNQDFYFPNAAVEVKTTLAREPSVIRIASERQLDKSSYPSLFIAHYSIDRSESNGMTLPVLIDEIKNKLKGDSDAENYFDTALFELGYIDAHAEKYNSKYSVRDLSFYEVTEAFPKITEDMLPNGVGDVQYGISISECRHYIVEKDKVLKLIKNE